ncbi:MAG: peptidylprolyl isomerase [Gammaproteobacteria bacterium]
MPQYLVGRYFKELVVSTVLLFAACSDQTPEQKPDPLPPQNAAEPDDVIARVGSEVITFSEVNKMLNDSALLGMSPPEPGSPEREQLMIELMDKAIAANLIYLDAKNNGIDRLRSYTEDVARFEDALIASLYKSRIMIGDIQVSESEIRHFYNTHANRETELSDDFKLAIGSMIRQHKMDELEATLRQRFRKDVVVAIKHKVLSADYDNKRSDADVVATYNHHRISWSQVKALMLDTERDRSPAAFYIENDADRHERLEHYLDEAIMALKGRAAGLENDPEYIRRAAAYRKVRLINEHRNGLIHRWNPAAYELRSYYFDNRDKIVTPPARKLQMVVVGSKEKADAIKAQIDNNEITLSEAAQQYSIDPDARRTLGDLGWVSRGSGYQQLEDVSFGLEPGAVGGPVESPAGWHLVMVLDVSPARYQNFDEEQTRQRSFKAYMQERFDDYVENLRQRQFEVVVYEGELQRQQAFIAGFNRTDKAPPGHESIQWSSPYAW